MVKLHAVQRDEVVASVSKGLHLEPKELCNLLDRDYKFILLSTVYSETLSIAFLTDSKAGN
jgi:Fe2+ or Zn2+ uptake regulation protein